MVLSENVVNISEDGILYDLPQSATITLKLSTIPRANSSVNRNSIGFIEPDSLVEVELLTDPAIFLICTFEPGFVSFTNTTWSKESQIVVTAVDDLSFTAEQILVEIDFAVKSVDPRFHNISVEPLIIHIWDNDRLEVNTKEPYVPWMDPRILSAIIALALTAVVFALSRWRKRRQERKEWGKHHELLRNSFLSYTHLTITYCRC